MKAIKFNANASVFNLIFKINNENYNADNLGKMKVIIIMKHPILTFFKAQRVNGFKCSN